MYITTQCFIKGKAWKLLTYSTVKDIRAKYEIMWVVIKYKNG